MSTGMRLGGLATFIAKLSATTSSHTGPGRQMIRSLFLKPVVMASMAETAQATLGLPLPAVDKTAYSTCSARHQVFESSSSEWLVA